jgi:hypothetical protein
VNTGDAEIEYVVEPIDDPVAAVAERPTEPEAADEPERAAAGSD